MTDDIKQEAWEEWCKLNKIDNLSGGGPEDHFDSLKDMIGNSFPETATLLVNAMVRDWERHLDGVIDVERDAWPGHTGRLSRGALGGQGE